MARKPRVRLLGQGSAQQDVVGAVLMFAIAVPAVSLGYVLVTRCPSEPPSDTPLSRFCSFALARPVATVNWVLFWNVDVLFWLANLAQGSTWLIDPYWQGIPMLISLFYWSHPHAEADSQRSALALGVLWVWALRLLYNYFRREEWHFGLREDWRFADMRLRFPRNWWWLSFFVAYVSQHALLFAATLPLYAVHSSRAPLGAWDVAAAAVALAGVLVQGVADYQLREFMVANALRQARGEKKVLVLNSGLWYYSRHPNYFGEQLFWWGMALFAVGLGRPLYVAGAALMTLLFHGASLRLVESRMREDPQRREAFDEYVRTTSPFLPLPKFA